MWQVVIDTSHKNLYLGLLKDNVFVDGICELALKMHSEKIVPAISDLLHRNSLTPKDITQAYIGLGPGSFTGVRIGLTVIKTWCILFNLEVFGFSSFDFLLPQKYGMVVLDARAGRAYVGIKTNDIWTFKGTKTYDELKTLDCSLCVGDTHLISQVNNEATLPQLCENIVIKSNRIENVHNVEPYYIKSL